MDDGWLITRAMAHDGWEQHLPLEKPMSALRRS
ncbi:hypothetical protein Tco_0023120, partial [Tanacetum coccineum]